MNYIVDIKRVYFVGIGGIGMSAIAQYFLSIGKQVAGYDRTPSQITDKLQSLGVQIHFSDDINLVPDSFKLAEQTLVIYTPAIPANHTELNYFKNNGFNLVKRSQALGVIAQPHLTVGVAGTHGKTSTSTMLAHILGQSSFGCNAFLGGISKNYSSNLVLSDKGKNLLVVEADEFDRSFLTLNPYLAVVTSIDADHLDIYGTYEHVIEAFNQYAKQIKPNGFFVKSYELDFNPALAQGVKVVTYGFNLNADVHAINVEIVNGFYHFDAVTPTHSICGIELGVPGRYNLQNALAAIASSVLLGVADDEIRQSLKSFSGVVRRFDVRYRGHHSIYIDDYAHHPNEILAMIDSARHNYPGRKIVGIFQPHLYTRTRDFAADFAAALDKLDVPILLDIYPARELPIEGVSTNSILSLMKNANRVLMSKEQVLKYVETQNIDVLLTMGAGDIDRLVPQIAGILENENK